jgi:hypothetical protein
VGRALAPALAAMMIAGYSYSIMRLSVHADGTNCGGVTVASARLKGGDGGV